jgi:hypothetical protein
MEKEKASAQSAGALKRSSGRNSDTSQGAVCEVQFTGGMDMPVTRILGDLLQEYYDEKKSGVLFIGVKEKSENLIRIFLHEGVIRHLSYGTCTGKDCLEILDCYEYTTAYFVKDMKAPAISEDLPPMPQIIEQFRRSGRSVVMQ